MSGELTGSVRAFVAIHLPAEVANEVARVQAELRRSLRGNLVRWTPPEQIHLTLRFLGEVTVSALPALAAALQPAVASVAPFQLWPEGLGAFPRSSLPQVLWIGLHGDTEPLARLQAQIDVSTGSWGVRESRPFHPHLTLGRTSTRNRSDLQQIASILTAASAPKLAAWRISEVILMRSELRPGGAEHSCLATFRLGA